MVDQVVARAKALGLRAANSPGITSIALAFLIGALMIAVTGNSPIGAYQAMFEGAFSGSGLRNTIARSLPIVAAALALAVPFRAGIINLGGEGQMVVGGLAGTLTAIYLDGPAVLVILVSLTAGAVAGAAWAGIAAIGQTWLQLPILITSLLLNYPARALTGYLVRFPFADPTVTSSSTVPVPPEVRIPKFPVFGGVSVIALAIVVLVVVIAVLNRRTVAGYENAMTGRNARFARYGGVSVPRQTIGAMLISGAIAGFTGTYLVTGEIHRFLDGDLVASGFAWTGLLVTLLARHRPFAILAAGLFFAVLQSGGLAMQRTTEVPWQLAQVIQAVVIIALVSRFAFHFGRKGDPQDPAEDPTVPPVEDDVPVGEV